MSASRTADTTGDTDAPPPRRTEEERLARHLAAGRRKELKWVFDLGRLARACCRARRRGDRAVPALAAANHTSKQRLYRAMRFARLFTPADVRRLAEAGVTWGKVSQVLRLRPADRAAALAEAARSPMTDRVFRVWLDERHGPGLPRAGRPAATHPAGTGAVVAKNLAADCRRMARRYRHAPGVLAAAAADLDGGGVPGAAEMAWFREAAAGVAELADLLAATRPWLTRIVAAADAPVAVATPRV